jgi:hypothetical protein
MNERILRTGTPVVNSTGKKPAKKTEMNLAGFNDVFQRDIFNREQAAIFTTLSVESLDKAVERGDLVSHNEGVRVLFLRDDLIDFVRRCPSKSQKRQQKEMA